MESPSGGAGIDVLCWLQSGERESVQPKVKRKEDLSKVPGPPLARDGGKKGVRRNGGRVKDGKRGAAPWRIKEPEGSPN